MSLLFDKSFPILVGRDSYIDVLRQQIDEAQKG